MLRRLEDQIRYLCAKAVASEDSPGLDEVFEQVRAALHEHNERLRKSSTEPQFARATAYWIANSFRCFRSCNQWRNSC